MQAHFTAILYITQVVWPTRLKALLQITAIYYLSHLSTVKLLAALINRSDKKWKHGQQKHLKKSEVRDQISLNQILFIVSYLRSSNSVIAIKKWVAKARRQTKNERAASKPGNIAKYIQRTAVEIPSRLLTAKYQRCRCSCWASVLN